MNTLRITQTSSTIATLMGFSMPADADTPNQVVMDIAKEYFDGNSVDKVLMYNPDAIALWLYQKYTDLFTPTIQSSQIALPIHSVMPSVTPVCFASMYTGLLPEKHGIQSYKKPVLKVTTLFDAAIAAGKKPIIISQWGASITEIFKERKMDYISFGTAEECNKKAIEVLKENKHDLIIVYNGNYDSTMHKSGPESEDSLNVLKENAKAFKLLTETAQKVWDNNNYITAFLPDHGCHEIDGNCGSHGLDMPEDMDIIHFYNFHKSN